MKTLFSFPKFNSHPILLNKFYKCKRCGFITSKKRICPVCEKDGYLIKIK